MRSKDASALCWTDYKKKIVSVYQSGQLALQNFLLNPIKNYLFSYVFEAGARFY